MSKNYLIAIVAVLVLGGGFYYFSTKSPQTSVSPSPADTSPVSHQPVTQQKPVAPATSSKTTTPTPATKAPAPVAKPVISAVSMGTSLSANGAIVNPTTTFGPTTPKIYAVLSLKNATARTQLSYIRYYNGKYVDSKVSHPSINNVSYFHFEWTLKPGQTQKAGNYSLVFYINGKKASTVNYTIK